MGLFLFLSIYNLVVFESFDVKKSVNIRVIRGRFRVFRCSKIVNVSVNVSVEGVEHLQPHVEQTALLCIQR